MELAIFHSSDGKISLSVQLEEDTVWLSQSQLIQLFERDQSVISRHINNALKEELDKKSNMHFLHIANPHWKGKVMEGKIEYVIEVRETLCRLVRIQAKSLKEALGNVTGQYRRSEIVLGPEDFQSVEIEQFPN